MSNRVLMLAVVLVLLTSCAAGGEEVDTKPTVIKLKLKTIDGVPTLVVGPRGAGVCKKADSKKCPGEFAFRWIGNKDFNADKLRIEFEDTAKAEACFGKAVVDLPKTNEVQRVAVTPETCTLENGKTALFYTVKCLDAQGQVCAGVAPVDPGVIIESGGP